MIRFKTVRWKNFLSTGNQWTQIDFEKNDTTLIIGTNGAGKSTVLDALTFSLFNKPFRKINKPQLVNSTNEKDCKVEIEFDVGTRQYKVIRGIKPSIFEIWVDGKMLNQDAAASDQQKYLENNILKLNYKSFTQIVILGSSTFVPFMQLPANSRREVIEDLLDIRIFSAMNGIIKDKIRSNREEIKVLSLKKDGLSDKVEMQKEFIQHLEGEANQEIVRKVNKIDELKTNIQQITDNTKSLTRVENTQRSKMEDLSFDKTKMKKLGGLRGKITQKVSTLTKELEFFQSNTVCPTCTQSIEDEFRLNKIADAQTKETELTQGLKELESAIKEQEEKESQWIALSKEVSQLSNDISQNNTRISGIQRQIGDLGIEIQRITDQLQNRNTEHEKLNALQQQLNTVYDELVERKEDSQYKEFVYSLLKDGGVKSKIIKKYLPLINKQVNKYLQMMDFYINFTLDEEFNEKVQSPIHEDFSYASFSEGEKMRIDLALLFTWREVAAFKNSTNTNLLIMDEVFDSSLDGFGTDEFLKIIRYVIKGANIFVISHKDGLQDKFGSVIQFEKVKGFSRMVS
ncbi:SbcC-like subunit of palindrome specific endonuclease [Synechococcus virus S-PRM1]|uniref:Recombinase endonuclease subunit n=1 Tax=Synechococcus virus S-PRM1 TaxID=2100130 RepID=A0A346FKL1_9CAUD|nr:SbcC-like subunit of palindrome specific endonuclease [Synechococcus virus S-PRM1]AXN58516.1 recombinase endonuclease subunit [Synechococcus virus S-PRM1]